MIHEVNAQMLSLKGFRLYATCMYRPSLKEYAKLVGKYIFDPETHCFGFWTGSRLVGSIVVRKGEIIAIAVQKTYRRKNIGRSLIEHVQSLYPVLIAETDMDSVGFYRACGFSCTAFHRTFPDGVVTRYKCIKISF